MGNKTSQIKISFDEVQNKIKGANGTAIPNITTCIFINTLPENKQSCLIPTTTVSSDEEGTINKLLKNNSDVEIIIYGMNNNDESVIRKYKQLVSLGFQNIYIYLGGMFEWLLLQDIYGTENFPTTSRELDIMKYKPSKKIDTL
jgi:hypothetical protein